MPSKALVDSIELKAPMAHDATDGSMEPDCIAGMCNSDNVVHTSQTFITHARGKVDARAQLNQNKVWGLKRFSYRRLTPLI